MSEIEVIVPDAQVQELRRIFAKAPRRIPSVLQMALRKGVDKMFTLTTRAAAQNLGVPRRVLTIRGKRKRKVWRSRPRKGRLWARVRTARVGISLGLLRPKQFKRGVKASFGGSRQLVEGSFLRVMRGTPVVFVRTGADRLPIEAVRTRTVTSAVALDGPRILAEGERIMMAEAKRQIERQMLRG